MGYLNNQVVTVDAILTKKGRELLAKGDYGKMVALKGLDVVSIPLEDVAEKTKFVPDNHLSIISAKAAGTVFGD